MSDAHREPAQDDAPTSRFPAGRDSRSPDAEPVGASQADGSAAAGSGGDATAGSGDGGGDASGAVGDGPSAGSASPGAGTGPGTGAAASTTAERRPEQRRERRRMWQFGAVEDGPADARQLRRRRLFLVGVGIAAVVVVVALCVGSLSVVSAIRGVRDRATEARAARELRETHCLELEQRLNRLTPPGSTIGPAARATAIRDEDAALRLYLDELDSQREQDAWRQLLDARTVFADALDKQAKSRTPAFFVAPRTADGLSVTDELARWAPAQCAGPIRRLAAPEL